MTDGADPALLRQLAENQSAVESGSTGIRDEVRTTVAELAEQSRRAREANEQFCAQLDEQVEARRDGRGDDDADTNRGPSPTGSDEADPRFGFEHGDLAPDMREEHAAWEQRHEWESTTTGGRDEAGENSTAAQRGRHARRSASNMDDDDFANTDWTVG